MFSDISQRTGQPNESMRDMRKSVQDVAPLSSVPHGGTYFNPCIDPAAPSNATGMLQTLGETSKPYEMVVKEAENAEFPPVMMSDVTTKTEPVDHTVRSKRKYVEDATPVSVLPYCDLAYDFVNLEPIQDGRTHLERAPAMIFLPSHPTKQDWANITAATKSGFALTGTAAMGQIGPIIGLRDIGECEDFYMFRVALPRVERDQSKFDCLVCPDGEVKITGLTTTGEKSVCRFSQVFEMMTRNFCPSGRFTIRFNLPGRVIPEEFVGNYGNDGILEGIVKKEKRATPTSQP